MKTKEQIQKVLAQLRVVEPVLGRKAKVAVKILVWVLEEDNAKTP